MPVKERPTAAGESRDRSSQSGTRDRDDSLQKLYRKLRAPEIVAELKRIGEERKSLADKRSDKALSADDRKKVNQRWHYLALRTSALKKERQTLSEGSSAAG